MYPLAEVSWRASIVRRLAATFTLVLLEWEVSLHQVAIDNRSLPEDVCASHDYCDANMAMQEAFEAQDIDPLHCYYGPFCTTDLWNDAWSFANARWDDSMPVSDWGTT